MHKSKKLFFQGPSSMKLCYSSFHHWDELPLANMCRFITNPHLCPLPWGRTRYQSYPAPDPWGWIWPQIPYISPTNPPPCPGVGWGVYIDSRLMCSEFSDTTALDFHKLFSIAIMNMSVAHSSEANTSTRCKQSFTGSLNPRRRILVHRSCLFLFRLFEERATGVLDECFEENEKLSQKLLLRELDHHGNLTCLDLAVSGDSQDFIAHEACQLLLTRLWMGALAMNTTSFKVI